MPTAVPSKRSIRSSPISANGVSLQRDKERRAINSNGIAIIYDGEDRPLSFTYASGKAVTCSYDSVGRLCAGRMTSLTYPDSVATNSS
jgi:YD repeat-containing protein